MDSHYRDGLALPSCQWKCYNVIGRQRSVNKPYLTMSSELSRLIPWLRQDVCGYSNDYVCFTYIYGTGDWRVKTLFNKSGILLCSCHYITGKFIHKHLLTQQSVGTVYHVVRYESLLYNRWMRLLEEYVCQDNHWRHITLLTTVCFLGNIRSCNLYI